MFEIGGRIYFLVQQRNGDVTLEEGEIISHDIKNVCMTTYVGGDNSKIRFIEKEYVFDNEKDGVEAHDEFNEKIREIKKSTKRLHISLFERKT